jgi:hypothetical protein
LEAGGPVGGDLEVGFDEDELGGGVDAGGYLRDAAGEGEGDGVEAQLDGLAFADGGGTGGGNGEAEHEVTGADEADDGGAGMHEGSGVQVAQGYAAVDGGAEDGVAEAGVELLEVADLLGDAGLGAVERGDGLFLAAAGRGEVLFGVELGVALAAGAVVARPVKLQVGPPLLAAGRAYGRFDDGHLVVDLFRREGGELLAAPDGIAYSHRDRGQPAIRFRPDGDGLARQHDADETHRPGRGGCARRRSDGAGQGCDAGGRALPRDSGSGCPSARRHRRR